MADKKVPYKIEPENWFKAKPYGFAFYDRSSSDKKDAPAKRTVWLPISPQNIQVTTPMATNVITTLYGVVEEHSEVRYHEITISGTTGISPKYVGYLDSTSVPKAGKDKKMTSDQISSGRLSFDLGSKVPAFGTFIDSVTDLAGATPTNESGLDVTKTGYYAFHKLYQFFLLYKEDTAGNKPNATKTTIKRKRHPLTFLNYKDNIQYDCVPLVFNLTRSATDPMLYNYTIQLRAYNLDTIVSSNDAKSFLEAADQLGLFANTGAESSASDDFADIADLAGAVGSFLGGL